MDKQILSFQISKEFGDQINEAIEHRHFRSRSDFLREGAKEAMKIAQAREEIRKQIIAQSETAEVKQP